MLHPPSVSVIIPAHNSALYLAGAVASIRQQGHEPLEVIIVDDGSTDETGAVAAALQAGPGGRIHVAPQPQAGPAAARNRGLGLAGGGIIGFLDADDLWPEDSLRCRLAALQADPTLAFVLGRSRLLKMDPSRGDAGQVSPESFLSPLLGSALFRRSVFGEVGEFDPSLRFGEDVDWFLRAREHAVPHTTITETTLLYRRHTSNMTRGRSMADLKVMEVLKRSLDRRRQASGVALPLPRITRQSESLPVSVVIAVYNGERYLADAIRSVLAQTQRPREVIVVDDGSTDGSVAIAEGFAPDVQCYARPHAGVGAALNFGVAQATGEFLAFLDADDLWASDKLARQVSVFGSPGEPDMVFGHAQQFLSPELTPEQRARLLCPTAPMPGIVKGTLLIRRGVFARVGPFDTTHNLGDFIDWYLRAREAGLGHVLLPDVLLRRRIHHTSLGTRERDSRADYAHILKASLDRRRTAESPKP
jgi:glycosyltransferase involved in cell wall biosynthesis